MKPGMLISAEIDPPSIMFPPNTPTKPSNNPTSVAVSIV